MRGFKRYGILNNRASGGPINNQLFDIRQPEQERKSERIPIEAFRFILFSDLRFAENPGTVAVVGQRERFRNILQK